jgi:hypothetical protein
MIRSMMIAPTLLLLLLAAPGRCQAPPAQVPDPDYKPKVGDRAVLLSESSKKVRAPTWATLTAADFRAYKRSFAVGDRDQRREMHARGDALYLAELTPVLVVAVDEVGLGSDLAEDDRLATRATVRVLGGPMEGKKVYVAGWFVVRMVDPPAPTPAPTPTPAPPAVAPPPAPIPADSPRALAILNLGKNHERDRRVGAAISSYSQVANGWPGTIEADEARSRVGALGGVVDPKAIPPGIMAVIKADPRPRRDRRLPDFSAVNAAIDSMGAAAMSGSGPGSGRGSSLCGAATKAGGSCRNPVSGGGYCYLHR